jgi:diguanylate cyclase (GGDEF)-like protein
MLPRLRVDTPSSGGSARRARTERVKTSEAEIPWQLATAGLVAASVAVVALAQLLAGSRVPVLLLVAIPPIGALAAAGAVAWVGRALARARAAGEASALEDPQTGLASPLVAERMLALEFAAAQRHGRPLSVALFRIDHFSCYVARFVRPAAELVLRTVAETLQRRTREMNVAARYRSGEATYLTILADVPLEGAFTFAGRLRDELAALHDIAELQTVSAGVASYDPQVETPDALLERAERALAVATRDGGWTVAVGDRVPVAAPAAD